MHTHPLLDLLPDNSGHLIAIQFHHRVVHLDSFGHCIWARNEKTNMNVKSRLGSFCLHLGSTKTFKAHTHTYTTHTCMRAHAYAHTTNASSCKAWDTAHKSSQPNTAVLVCPSPVFASSCHLYTNSNKYCACNLTTAMPLCYYHHSGRYWHSVGHHGTNHKSFKL